MSRRIMLNTEREKGKILEETLADNEKQLQELIKDNPDLLPVEDLGMKGPLAVIGRETGLPSGAVDLVALSRDGDLLIVEFKTGPKNPDFRAALAQLVDYGSDLWGRDWESFERDVPLRYFKSDQCHNQELANCDTLGEALTYSWDNLDEDEFTALQENLAAQLSTGSFHYALLAQGFTDSVLKSIEYLNEVSSPRFYAIEVVRFGNEDVQAFEARLIKGPSAKPSGSTTRTVTTEIGFINQFPEGPYRDAMQLLLDDAKKSGYTINPGSTGISIRRQVPGSSVRLTVAWAGPPDKRIGPGARDVTLGSWARPKGVPANVTVNLEDAFRTLGSSLGNMEEIAKDAYGIHLTQETFMAKQDEVTDFMHLLATKIDSFSIESTDGGGNGPSQPQ